MLTTVRGDLDACDPFLRRDELVRIPQVKFLPFVIGELVIVVPQIPLVGCRFFERVVSLADSEMLVSLAFVVIGEDGRTVFLPLDLSFRSNTRTPCSAGRQSRSR